MGLVDFTSHFNNQPVVAGVFQVVAPTASGKTFIGYYVMDSARCLASFVMLDQLLVFASS